MTRGHQRMYVVKSAIVALPVEFGPARVVARLDPEGVKFQDRFDAGGGAEPGEFQLAVPGEPEFQSWKASDEDEVLRDWTRRYWLAWGEEKRARKDERTRELRELVDFNGGRSR